MKKATAEWPRKAEDDLVAARRLLRGRDPLKDQICFHCQQAAEKYLKALLQERGLPIQKTHNITVLLDQLIPTENGLRPLRRWGKQLTYYAVEYRYPGIRASLRQARAAYDRAGVFRR